MASHCKRDTSLISEDILRKLGQRRSLLTEQLVWSPLHSQHLSFHILTQSHLLLNFGHEKDIIKESFSVDDSSGPPCSTIEIAHYPSLLLCPHSALDDDPIKYRASNAFFSLIASFLCGSYPGHAEFKRYVFLLRFTTRC